MVAALPVPTVWVSAGASPSAVLNDLITWSWVIWPCEPCAGSWICVPPSNSMPTLKPRKTIEPMHTRSSSAKNMYQRLREPTMSTAPVPT